MKKIAISVTYHSLHTVLSLQSQLAIHHKTNRAKFYGDSFVLKIKCTYHLSSTCLRVMIDLAALETPASFSGVMSLQLSDKKA